MFELDLRSRKPIYEQLKDRIKESVMYGILKPDEQLPSVRMLSMQCSVNPNTVQKAYRELELEGVIYSLPGKGSFISPLKEQMNETRKGELRMELVKLLAEAVYYGFTDKDLLQMVEEARQAQERRHSHD